MGKTRSPEQQMGEIGEFRVPDGKKGEFRAPYEKEEAVHNIIEG